MAWYPGARKMELQPESDAQPAIRPTQLIAHSIIAPWDETRIYQYWRDSTNLESHFGLDYDGSMGQFIGTETRADANYRANIRPDGTGAISIETASNLSGTDPWTPEQLEELIKLGVWAHRTHAIPLRLCRTASDPGFGWHAMHADWSPNGTACPGAARIRQFKERVFPQIVARATGVEEDMPLTAEDVKKILTTDNIIPAAPDASNVDTNTHWTWQTHVYETTKAVRETRAAVAALKAKVDALQTTGLTDAQMDALAAKVASVLAERLKA